MLNIARRTVALAAMVAAIIAAAIALDFPQPAQAQSDEPTGRIVVRPWVDDDGDLTRVEFGFRPVWGEDVRGGGDGPDDLFPPKRFLTQRLIESSAGRWLRSSEILIPAAAGSEDGVRGRILVRAEAGDDGELTRIEFGFRPDWGADIRGTESGPDDIFPTNRFLTRALIDRSAAQWLRSSLITVPAERPPEEPTGDPAQATEPTEGVVGAAGGYATAEDGAKITVPAGAAEPGAKITARVIPESERPTPPLFATDFIDLWDFEVEGGITEPVTLSFPAPQDGGVWSVVGYNDDIGKWELVPFVVENGMVSATTDSLSKKGVAGFFKSVIDCGSDPIGCAKKGIDLLTDCVAKPKNCREVVVDHVSDLGDEFWGAAKEGARVIVGGIETGYSYVKSAGEWVVELGSQMVQTLKTAFVGLWNWTNQTVPPLNCEDESDNVLATLNPGQVLLQSCAEDEGEDEHRLRIKNMRRFWVQVCPGPLVSPDLRRAPNLDVLGPLSNCDLDGGTLLPSGREAEWISQLESPSEIRATFSDSAALMTMVDWILAIVGAADIEGKARIVLGVLSSLRQLDELSQLIEHAEEGRIDGVLSELVNILTDTDTLKLISDVIAKAAPSLGVEFGGSVIATALTVVELWRVAVKIGDLLSAHYSESGTFAAARFKRTDRPQSDEPDESDDEPEPLPPIGDGSLVVLAGTRDLYQMHVVSGSLFKRLILNPVVFNGYGFQLSDVRSVDQAEFDRWTTTDLARLGDDAQVWRLFPDGGEGTRRLLDITAEQFVAAGFDWDAVISINQTEFNAWREGVPITAAELGLESDDTLPTSQGSFSAVAITVGTSHACALLDSGAIECWGGNFYGQADAPGGAFSTVSAGGWHTCGLRASGAVVCWGRNDFGQTDAPGGAFSAISLDIWRTCGLRVSGAVVCWGWNDGEWTDAPGGAFSAVSTGVGHTCGLRLSGAVECWGDNSLGRTDAPGGAFSAVSTGGYHTCGLRASGAIECWGGNWAGQTDAPGRAFSAVSAGEGHTCGLRSNGAVVCWGDSWAGQTDAPGGAFSAVSAGEGHTCGLRTSGAVVCWGSWARQTDAPGGAFSAVSAGRHHTCGLRPSGAVECWGDNRHGQTDAPDGAFSAVSADVRHTCGLRASGAVVCWGWNDGGRTDAPDGAFSATSAGQYHTCGLRPNGAVVCWGNNRWSQTDAPGGAFSAVSAGATYTCGLRSNGAVVCWGDSWAGQTAAPGGTFSAVSAGAFHTCGLRSNGAVVCWGDNSWGRTDAPSGAFSAVSAGFLHTCGLRASGLVKCWGYMFNGQAQPPAGQQIAISSGDFHACALSEDGTVACWMIYNGAADVPAWLREPSALTASGNRPPEPIGAISTTTIATGSTNDDLRVGSYFRDADGDDLAYRASSSDSSIVSVRVRNDRLTVTGRRVGSATITVTATDPSGLSAQTSFRVTVSAPAPEPPEIRITCPAYSETGRSFRCTVRNRGGAVDTWDWSASGGTPSGRDETYSLWFSSFGRHLVRLTASNAGGSDNDSTTVRLVAAPPVSQYSRCGADRIKVWWFDRDNFRKHHVNLTGGEATRILGPRWWATIGHLTQPACDSWPTGLPLTAENYR